MIAIHAFAPLPGTSPPLLTSDCQFTAASAVVTLPSALRGRLKVFAMCGDGGDAPPYWKRRASSDLYRISAWSRSAPMADMAARCGTSTGLIVVQADTADDMAAVQATLGALPQDTVRSISRDGRLRYWMRIPAVVRSLPTRLDIAPGIRVLADGAYVRLPPAGAWTTPPDDPDADYQAIPPAWVAAILDHDAAPMPTVHYFH